jgi:hypothetical protein
MILADIGADVEDAVDIELIGQLAEMQRKITLLHLAQGHDIVAEGPADLEHRVLDDLEHDDFSAARTVPNNGC